MVVIVLIVVMIVILQLCSIYRKCSVSDGWVGIGGLLLGKFWKLFVTMTDAVTGFCRGKKSWSFYTSCRAVCQDSALAPFTHGLWQTAVRSLQHHQFETNECVPQWKCCLSVCYFSPTVRVPGSVLLNSMMDENQCVMVEHFDLCHSDGEKIKASRTTAVCSSSVSV